MKLFTKEIDKQLFAQYPKGSNLDNQMVVAKIFNPYGRGVWYLLNSDPQDPDYIWAIVDLFEPEMGSVSRSELQTIKVPPFGLGLERDIYFSPKPAKEVWQGMMRGERFARGGMTVGRFYTDNMGNEYRFIGESNGKLLFKDGDKVVTKTEEDFEEMPREKKLFGFFEHGGVIKVGETIKIKDGLKGSLMNIEGMDLEVKKITKYDFPSGIRKFYHVEYDGDKYEVREDLVDYEKMAQGGEVLMEINTHKAIKDGDKIIIYRKELEFDSNYDVIGEKLRFLYIIPIENEDDLLPIFEEFEETNRYLIDEANREMQGYKKGGMVEIGSEGMYKGGAAKVLKYDDKNKMYAIKYLNEDGEVDGDFVMARKDDFEYGFSNFDPKMADGGFVEKTDEELKGMSDDELFEYLDAKTAYMKQYTRPLSSYKAKNFAANATAVQFKNEGTAKLDEKFPNISKIKQQAEEDYQKGIKKIANKRNKMAMGGKVTFDDKVKAIQKSLLKRKKVAPQVQKDYGKTYDKKEALDSAKRIAGSLRAKYELKKK